MAIVSLLLLSSCSTNTRVNDQGILISTIYNQPVDPNGKLLLSSWLDPDGSDYDQFVWDNFTLQSNETITEINWFGVYDPLKFGAGGPVIDFMVSIYPSIAAGTEPDVAHLPLVHYQTGGNAGETLVGTANGITLYSYSFSLPVPFIASADTKYWVQIEAFQHGSSPDWCIAPGAGGDGSHYQWGAGAGGDSLYRFAPGDAAFTLLGPIADTATPTDTPTNSPTQTATATDTPTPTPTDTPIPTATDTPTNTPTDTPTATPSPTETATNTPTDTPTATPTDTPTNTPTSPPISIPLSNTPGKVTGGGNMDLSSGKATFGFVIQYDPGAASPSGNLTYQDHGLNLRLKATSFDLLVIEGDHVWFTGMGTMDDGQVVSFTVEIYALSRLGLADTVYISIPALNGYTAGGALNGGNIAIH